MKGRISKLVMCRIIFGSLLLLITMCIKSPLWVVATGIQPTYPGNDNWEITFEDGFDGTSLDETKWRIRGKEYANYHDASCVSVSDGNLLLQIKREADGNIVLGRVDTTGIEESTPKFQQKYGFFECRTDVPPTEDTYFAFWLNAYPGMGLVDGTGRDGAEIDICETVNAGDYTESVIHWDGYGSAHQSAASGNKYAPNIHEGFHIYGLEWDENTLKFYFDGQLTWTYSGVGVPRVAEILILSSGYDSSGGGWVEGSLANAQLPYYAKVDWVRVYSKVQPSEPVIHNASFEAGNTVGWDTSGSAAVVQEGKMGDYAARLTSNGWFEQTVTGLKPNTNYRMSVWVKTNTEPRFLVKNYGGPDVLIIKEDTNGEYEEHFVNFTTGADHTSARICFYHWWQNGESLADSFIIEELQ